MRQLVRKVNGKYLLVGSGDPDDGCPYSNKLRLRTRGD